MENKLDELEEAKNKIASLSLENAELAKKLEQEKALVKYLLGESVMVLADMGEHSLDETVAEFIRDNILESLWYYKLSEDQRNSLRRNVPIRLSGAFIEMEELDNKLKNLTQEFEEYKKNHG